MASNISKRLDRIERIANELLNQTEGPVYCREGQEPPDVSPERLVVVRRVYVKAAERPDLTLPLSAEPAGNLFGADARNVPAPGLTSPRESKRLGWLRNKTSVPLLAFRGSRSPTAGEPG